MEGFFTQALVMMGYRLPELLAVITGIVLLLGAPASAPGRGQALTGISMILGAALLGMATSVWQAWLIHSAAEGGYSSLGGMMTLIGVLSMVLSVVAAVGLVLLAWGAAKAMKAMRTA
jgi:hypothetical protein